MDVGGCHGHEFTPGVTIWGKEILYFYFTTVCQHKKYFIPLDKGKKLMYTLFRVWNKVLIFHAHTLL